MHTHMYALNRKVTHSVTFGGAVVPMAQEPEPVGTDRQNETIRFAAHRGQPSRWSLWKMVTAKRRIQKLEGLHDAMESRRVTSLDVAALAAEVAALNARGRTDRAEWLLSLATDAQLNAIAYPDDDVECGQPHPSHSPDTFPLVCLHGPLFRVHLQGRGSSLLPRASRARRLV